MVFSSLYFSFFFLPIVILIYYLSKNKYRNYILLIASIYFYSYGEPKFVFVLIGSIVFNYLVAIGISKLQKRDKSNKATLLLSIDVLGNIGLLFVYKYLDFSIATFNQFFKTDIASLGVVLPIGISFFTFQAMSYVIDVYRHKVEVQNNPLYLALYVSFFPQLIAGPIVRYSTIENQILNREYSMDKFADGVRRFFLGFGKKIILANNLACVVKEIFNLDYADTNPLILWIGSICYSMQILYDFSGYSDMAIGLGEIFGFEFEENFNYPYISKSITEFWRRWHISLGQWFRDYVYIPLGGSRVSVPRHIINMLVVWLLTGIWHGANYTFIAWGMGYFILLVLEKYIIKPEKRKNKALRCIWQLFTLLCINFGWVVFNSSEVRHGVKYCLAMLGYYHSGFMIDTSVIRYIREYGVFIVLGVLFSTPLMRIIKNRIANTFFSNILVPIGYGVLFLWSVSYVILGAHNPFIYFNF